jgi:lipopolysaccharide export system protein LptA
MRPRVERRLITGLARNLAGSLAALGMTVLCAQAAPQTPAKAEKDSPALNLTKGPIKITAERAELERRESALYRGNVKLVSAELELTGDRLELRQPAKGQYEATLTGRPARLKHKGVEDTPPVISTMALRVS